MAGTEMEGEHNQAAGSKMEGAETGDENGITMLDVLQEEEELEADVDAVLGASDDRFCTYDQGYLKRQALYACLTCTTVEGERRGGICLACSYHCHEGHELVELYTKRNFRCDCGNMKFPKNACKLIKDKDNINKENRYNHNFDGVYCTCARPYPDPDDPIEDEMIQCCICEDWYHGRHLGDLVPEDSEYDEMICQLCSQNHSFLQQYSHLAVKKLKAEGSTDKSDSTNRKSENDAEANGNVKSEVKTEAKENSENSKEKAVTVTAPDYSQQASQLQESNDVGAKVCKLGNQLKLLEGEDKERKPSAVFFSDKWRQQLCMCHKCKELYKDEGVAFLLDGEDTVSHYESQGKARNKTADKELKALSSLDRITQVEMVHEYNTLSTSLREYLKKFADNKKVVRDEDIREFFSQLSANKKHKGSTQMQYFCK